MGVKKALTVVCDNPHCLVHMVLPTVAQTNADAIAAALEEGWSRDAKERWVFCPQCTEPGEPLPEPYPEHNKLEEVQEQSQACGEFLEWLVGERGLDLCELHQECDGLIDVYLPVAFQASTLLAEHFGIDQEALEQEKRTMLKQLGEAQ